MRRVQNAVWRYVARLALGVGLLAPMTCIEAQFDWFRVPVEARIDDQQGFAHIGDIQFNPTNGCMSAVFRFRPGWEHLDDHYDFRWFQIVKDYRPPVIDPEWNRWYNPTTNQWERALLPFVDPAPGGWQYQYRQGGNPTNRRDFEGADYSPFYENDDDGNRYWFGSFSGHYFDPDDPSQRITHRDTGRTEIHIEREFSSFLDCPSKPRGLKVTFQTILAVVRNGENFLERDGNIRRFGKLAGFDWEISFESGVGQIISTTHIRRQDLAGKKADIERSLRFFPNWQTLQPDDFELVPEPASMLALTVGLTVLACRYRRRAA